MRLIPDGVVDERSITDIGPDELVGFDRVSWFAGIGGWEYALELAGWEGPVWTASLPCQPFSEAGKRKGKDDERHLLPHFLELVRAAKPAVIFGEQVPSAIRHGWLDDLCAAMEAEDYTVRAAVLGAHSAGAPHIRQRLYWVAHVNDTGLERRSGMSEHSNQCNAWESGMADGMGDAEHNGHIASAIPGSNGKAVPERQAGPDGTGEPSGASPPGTIPGWLECDWLYCRDGKHRPVKPGLKPLVNGLPKGMGYSGDPGLSVDATSEARVMRIKGYGNAIVPQVAAIFIQASMGIL